MIQKIEACMRGKLHQCTDLAIGSEALGALDQTNRLCGKLGDQLVDCFDGWIAELGDAKSNSNSPA